MLCRMLVLCAGIVISAAAGASEVVIVACQGPAPSSLIVTESSSSVGAPVVATGTPCAQAVADLLDARLRLVGITSPGVGVIYTFARN